MTGQDGYMVSSQRTTHVDRYVNVRLHVARMGRSILHIFQEKNELNTSSRPSSDFSTLSANMRYKSPLGPAASKRSCEERLSCTNSILSYTISIAVIYLYVEWHQRYQFYRGDTHLTSHQGTLRGIPPLLHGRPVAVCI